MQITTRFYSFLIPVSGQALQGPRVLKWLNGLNVIAFTLTFAATQAVFAEVLCEPRDRGGFQCKDYATGASIDIIPRRDGGYDTYNHLNGRQGEIIPRADGGFDIYNFTTGTAGEIIQAIGDRFDVFQHPPALPGEKAVDISTAASLPQRQGTVQPKPGGGFVYYRTDP